LFGRAQSYNVRFGWYNQTEQYAVTGGSALPNTWTHIAFTYNPSGGVGTLYVNGVSVGTPITGGNVNGGPPNTINGAYNYIGYYPAPGYFTGYMSNFRYVLGSMLYTSNFAPPIAPVTAVANTTMLLNFTNAGIIDNAMIADIETIADAKISTTQSKYGTSSIAFDGTGDYLSIYDPKYIASVGPGDFTFECWVYLNSLPGVVTAVYHLKNDTGLSTTVFVIELTQTGAVNVSTGTALIVTGTVSKISSGSWIHIACVRSAGIFKTYINGILDASSGSNTTAYNGTYAQIGAWRYSGYDSSMNGYIDDLRVTKGYARYTSNFTPPTSQMAGK
jgi:hypothetical protein